LFLFKSNLRTNVSTKWVSCKINFRHIWHSITRSYKSFVKSSKSHIVMLCRLWM
jgi:hypothetical protein